MENEEETVNQCNGTNNGKSILCQWKSCSFLFAKKATAHQAMENSRQAAKEVLGNQQKLSK